VCPPSCSTDKECHIWCIWETSKGTHSKSRTKQRYSFGPHHRGRVTTIKQTKCGTIISLCGTMWDKLPALKHTLKLLYNVYPT